MLWFPASRLLFRCTSWFCLVVLVFSAQRFAQAELTAGVAVTNITQDNPTHKINDPLLAKVLVLDDGKVRFAIVTVDLSHASDEFTQQVRKRAAAEADIVPQYLLINASHNHQTFDQVAADSVERIVRALKKAQQQMKPVSLRVARGREDRITMNRRLHLSSGKQWTIRRANPSPTDSSVVEVGTCDPEIGVLCIREKSSGDPLAVVYNFAGHAYAGAANNGVSADFPGVASRGIESAVGNNCVALFLQGAAGDITPVRYKDFDAPPPTEKLGAFLALSTLKAVQQAKPQAAPTAIRVVHRKLALPRRSRKDLLEKISALEKQQAEILDFFTGIGCGAHGAGTSLNFKSFLPLYMKTRIDPDHPAYASYLYRQEKSVDREDLLTLDAANRQRVEKYLAAIEKMEELIRLRSNLQILKTQYELHASEPLAAEIQVVKIGEFVLVTFPGELFADIGLKIKKRSPFQHTYVAGFSGGHVGYAPQAGDYEDIAYEDSLSRLAPSWQKLYEAAVFEMLAELKLQEKE